MNLLSITDLATQPSTWTVYDNGVTLYDNIVPSGLLADGLSCQACPLVIPDAFSCYKRRIWRVASCACSLGTSVGRCQHAKINEVIQTTGADVIGFQELGRVGSGRQIAENGHRRELAFT